MSTEDELLRLASRLDTMALAQIYDIYSPALYRYTLRLLGDACLAEDCVAETFARFLKSLQTSHGPRDHLQAYLYRIAHNWIVDLYRSHRQTFDLSDSLACQEAPEKQMDRRLRQKQVRRAIRALTPDQQKVIALKYLEDWSNEEVARALHKPVGAIKSIQHRALASLKKLLTDETDEQSTRS